MNQPWLLLCLALVLAVARVDAAEVLVSPRGEVKQVRQAMARFPTAMVPFGEPERPAPYAVDCLPAQEGKGRWLDAYVWVFDFARQLPGGVRCELKPRDNLRDAADAPVFAAASGFDTGGPVVVWQEPFEGHQGIDENQIFLLGLSAEANAESIAAQASCEVAGVGERLPVRLLSGEERARLLAARRLALRHFRQDWQRAHPGAKADAAPVVALQCQRPLPPKSAVTLVWGAGINATSGLATRQPQRLAYKVRPQFSARLSCSRSNPKADCLPMLPIELIFSAPVPREQLAGVKLSGAEGRVFTAKIDEDPGEGERVTFRGPFPERAELRLELPPKLLDDAGRRLANAHRFPLKLRTDEYPPLAKFPARFGIIEASDPVLPVTLRNLEADLAGKTLELSSAAVTGKSLRLADPDAADAPRQVLDWLRQVKRAEYSYWVPEAGGKRQREIRPGSVALLGAETQAMRFTLSKPGGPRSFEVLGIPLARPGFYVVEVASPRLGEKLHGNKEPYFAQTAALVTNLSVHFKQGRENSLVWVSSLDLAQPVAGARLRINDCKGREYWQGTSDGSGLARVPAVLPKRGKLAYCEGLGSGLIVSATRGDDFSFVWSGWNEGLQPWRFNLPGGGWEGPVVAHAILDRSLLRAGETVSMKLLYRRKTGQGFSFVDAKLLPKVVRLVHEGSDEKFEVPVKWDARASAEAKWRIPKEAKLGSYRISLADRADGEERERSVGNLRVEAFRVPTLKATLLASSAPLIGAEAVDLGVQISYLSGGTAAGLAVNGRGLVLPHGWQRGDYETFSFSNGKVTEGKREHGAEDEGDAEFDGEDDYRPPLGRALRAKAITLDAAGSGKLGFGPIAASDQPQRLVLEAEYREANGETASAARQVVIWPAAVDVGIASDQWAAAKDEVRLKLLALDLAGKPLAKVPLQVEAFSRRDYSHRKRLLGGFYAYQNFTETQGLGLACKGESDARGEFLCSYTPKGSGQHVFQVSARDEAGRVATAHREVWVPGEEDWWFKAEANDRMDLIPEKRRYEPGETARLQMRAPFQSGTVLVTVEREGVLEAYTQTFDPKRSIIEVPMKAHFAPNVYVSALVVRGRVEAPPPTALVDLAKPTFRLGIAALEVGWSGHRLDVKVAPRQETYRVREKAEVQFAVRRTDGSLPPKDTELAVAVVDEGLLQLRKNESWQLLDAMMKKRGIEVETASAQQQVVGKRHFGKKAVAAGGGGGQMGARELFDTLLLWRGRVRLDAQGEARLEVPLNDSLTRFRVVAVAEGASQFFGTGEASFGTTQEVMLLSALPQVVREGDRFDASFTLRNTTKTEKHLVVSGEVTPTPAGVKLALAPRQLTLGPEAAVTLHWPLAVPESVARLTWELSAREGEVLADRLRVRQNVVPVVPLEVQQATLVQLDGRWQTPLAAPAAALPGRGGPRVELSPRLAGSLAGVTAYMGAYPYSCTEQRASVAVALQDRKRWEQLMAELPGLLDGQGLAKYFGLMREGSEVLTAYLMQLAAANDWEIPEAVEERLRSGLRAFVEGRLQRPSELATADFSYRRLAAMAALSAHGHFEAKWLDSLVIDPGLWPSSAVLDWLGILQRAEKLPRRAERLAQAKEVLRARLNWQGTSAALSTERGDYLWWLMVSGDSNINRMLWQLADEAEWRADIGKLARGALARQQRGHWNTTPANAWGVIAFERFSSLHEAAQVDGETRGSLEQQTQRVAWKDEKPSAALRFAWPAGSAALTLEHQGGGKPWVMLQSIAAVPVTEPLARGFTLTRKIEVVEQAERGAWRVGDVLRVTLEFDAPADLTWVALTDPLPPGATVVGSGLGGDSAVLACSAASRGTWDGPWAAFEERQSDLYRVYYRFVPRGRWTKSYLLRLNQNGEFHMPASRIEAMYAPEMSALWPNGKFAVRPAGGWE